MILDMEAKQLEKLFHTLLAPHGFKKKGATWYLESDDVIGLVNLQSSNFGDQFYVNLAVWLKVLGDNPTPKEHQCPVRTRLTSAFPDEQARFEQAFDFESESLSDTKRAEEISEIVNKWIIPFARKIQNLDSLKSAIDTDELRNAAISLKAKEYLSSHQSATG